MGNVLAVGQIWRGVLRSNLRSVARVTEGGNFEYLGDDPTVPPTIDVSVLKLPDPRFPTIVMVEALGVDRPSGALKYWEEVDRVTAGKLEVK
jgi:hypothetical protein